MRKNSIEGMGLFGGRSRLEFSSGRRLKINMWNDNSYVSIPLSLENIQVENHTLVMGKNLMVVEHLLSALNGLGIFNIQIDVFGKEVPFFDGSSQEFVKILAHYPESPPPRLKVNTKILVKGENSYILYEPMDGDVLFVEMELEHPYIGTQKLALTINRENYIKEIAPARTFVFTTESDPRLKKLPPYGIGITAQGIYAHEPLRFDDEPVRHKILDFLGDLYVLKRKLTGRIKAKNTSHALNLQFVKMLDHKSTEC
ncbi:MAG: UDP-3-O-acyl-N-acetylglucosamine deacetylase [candidate division WOR-3 bacterium]